MSSSSNPRSGPQIRQLKKLLKNKPFALADYHNIGIEMEKIKRSITGTRHQAGWRKKLADKLGVSDSMLSKCLQFRRCYRRKKDLQSVKEFKWGHLVLTLGLDEQQRLSLLNQAEEQDWDVWELQREIQRRKGVCRGGGHPRKRPKSFGLLPDVIQLLRLSERWNERYENACKKTLAKGILRSPSRISVPALREQLTGCLNELNRLLGNAADAKELANELLAKLPAEVAGR